MMSGAMNEHARYLGGLPAQPSTLAQAVEAMEYENIHLKWDVQQLERLFKDADAANIHLWKTLNDTCETMETGLEALRSCDQTFDLMCEQSGYTREHDGLLLEVKAAITKLTDALSGLKGVMEKAAIFASLMCAVGLGFSFGHAWPSGEAMFFSIFGLGIIPGAAAIILWSQS